MKKLHLHLSLNTLPFLLAIYYVVIVNVPLTRELFNLISASQSESTGFILSIPVVLFCRFLILSFTYSTGPSLLAGSLLRYYSHPA